MKNRAIRIIILAMSALLTAVIATTYTNLPAQAQCMDTCSWDGSCYGCHTWMSYQCERCCQACPMPGQGGNVMSTKYPTLFKKAEGRKLPPGHAAAVKRVLATQQLHACNVQPAEKPKATKQ